MKRLSFVPFVLLSYHMHSQAYNLENPDVPVRSNITHYDFVHVDQTVETNSDVVTDQVIGKISPFPSVLSDGFQEELILSRQYYNQGDFHSAQRILIKAIKKEPDNKFILEAYARALYWIDDKKDLSYATYKRLIELIDLDNGKTDTVLTVDLWFREAYWKLGTLHMDNKKWTEAFEEISRFMMCIHDMKGTPVYIQALEYLTECAFMTNSRPLCEHLANRTLLYDPANDNVKYYLREIKKQR